MPTPQETGHRNAKTPIDGYANHQQCLWGEEDYLDRGWRPDVCHPDLVGSAKRACTDKNTISQCEAIYKP